MPIWEAKPSPTKVMLILNLNDRSWPIFTIQEQLRLLFRLQQ